MSTDTKAAAHTVYSLLRTQARNYAAHELLVVPPAVQALWGLPQSSWTYAQFLARVDELADRYRSAGLIEGQRVALLLGNRPEHYFHWLAINAVGASAVPIGPDATAAEMSYLLSHSESVALVTTADKLGQLRPIARQANVVICDDSLSDLTAIVSTRHSALATPSDRECALLYTSGTTGQPKGCLLSNHYFFGWSDWYCAQDNAISLRPGRERLITPLPTFHINAMGNSFMGMLATGGAQIIVDRFHPSTWWNMAVQTDATCFHYLGVMPAMLLQMPHNAMERRHQLRFGMGGGVQPEHHKAFESRFQVPLLEGWAMTETGGAGIHCAADEPRHVGQRCIGRSDRAGPPVRTRLVDDNGCDVAPGEIGELWLQADGPQPRRQFFSGYLKDDDATDRLWDGGWLHTGDMMVALADGSLCFVDRLKNIIRRSGENIAAAQVESVLTEHDDVKLVAVIGTPDPVREEEVLAVVVPHTDRAPHADLATRLLAHCAEHLSYYKLPGWMAFVDALPVTATQKVRKAQLQALAKDPHNNAGAIDLRKAKQAYRAS